MSGSIKTTGSVALLAEGVDRNTPPSRVAVATGSTVALLAEGVDRNHQASKGRGAGRVALLAEGVDRNYSDGRRDAYKERRPPRGGRG